MKLLQLTFIEPLDGEQMAKVIFQLSTDSSRRWWIPAGGHQSRRRQHLKRGVFRIGDLRSGCLQVRQPPAGIEPIRFLNGRAVFPLQAPLVTPPGQTEE